MHNPSRPAKCTVDLMTKLPYCTDDVRSALKSQIIELFWGRVFEVSYGRTSINRRALTLRCTSKVTPHCCTRGGGGGSWRNSPLVEFLICYSISKRFWPQWKAFDLLYEMRYILWVVVLLKVCDVIKHGGHFGCHLVFYQELEIRLKQWELIFFVHNM